MHPTPRVLPSPLDHEIGSDEAVEVATSLASATVPAAEKEAFLEALARRGETPGEIAAFARAFRALARDPGLQRWAPAAIDVCGTGGDRSGTFNISTAVAFVLAAAGVPVIKHGNRSVTSQCGSADVLEALGLRIDADTVMLQRSLAELNFAFLFAPAFHPAFKEIGPVRRALGARGVRTIFNVLGPLLNPARPAYQVMGVFAAPLVGPVAQALDALELAAGLVVHSVGADGRAYDELTVVGENRAAGFGRLRDTTLSFDAAQAGLAPSADPAALAGGDAATNIALLERVLAGDAPAPLIDTIVLNAAAALHVVGRAGSIADAVADARDWLFGGPVRAWLERARAFHRP